MCTFPGNSAGEESSCNAGDLGSIPGLGRSTGEGIGYPLQHSCWKIPWTEESDGLQKAGHDCETEHTHTHAKYNILDM